MNKEEIKNEFINCIEESHTLNLAISILEDREELQQENKQLKEEIEEYKRIEETDYETIGNLENILEELESWLEETENYFEIEYKTTKRDSVYMYYKGAKNAIGDALLKIKELEEGKK